MNVRNVNFSEERKDFLNKISFEDKIVKSNQSRLSDAVDVLVIIAEAIEIMDKQFLINSLSEFQLTVDERMYLAEYIEEYKDPIKGIIRNKSILSENNYSTEGERFAISIIGDNIDKGYLDYINSHNSEYFLVNLN